MGAQSKVNKTRRDVAKGDGKGKVVMAFIHPGQTSAFFTTSLVGSLLFDSVGPRRVVGMLNEWSSANVSAARNTLVAKFLDNYPQAEWLWFVDADMAWDHDALDRLMVVADRDTAPVLGGLCFGASGDALFPTIYRFTEVDGKITTYRVNDYARDSVVQVAATGAAFLLIHRRVLEAMRAKGFNKAFPWFQETELAGDPCGEDITFCIRAGLLDIPVHVHTGVKVGHHKSQLLTEELFTSQQEAAS